MVPDITKTAELVQEITAASEEQAGGVGQITGTMQQLDQVTQQNAAASEELAATSQEMRGQSQSLIELISFFRLSNQQPPTTRSSGKSPTNGNGSHAVMDFAEDQTAAQQIMAGNTSKIDESQFDRF